MATVAETAELAVLLKLKDELSGPLGTTNARIKELEAGSTKAVASTSMLSGAVSKAGKEVHALGAHLSYAKGAIGGLLSGPLGILGLGAGILGLGTLIGGALQKTSDFGLSLERLTALTGESAQSMGELALVASKFGVDFDRLSQIVGFTEKTLGRLENTSAHVAGGSMTVSKATEEVTKAHEKLTLATIKLNEAEAKKHVSAATMAADQIHVADATRALTKAEGDLANARANQGVQGLNKLQALQKQYGVVLTDSKGQALSFSVVLAHVADYYTSNASAANKAALAATVFGRGYAALIPVLSLGAAGIQKSRQAIEDLGLSLGTDTQGAITAYKNSLRSLGEAVDILEISIGLGLAPTITDVANSVTLFLEHGGAKQIVQLFKDGAKNAQAFGKFIGDDVIPPLQTLGSAAAAAWNAIPDPLKQILIGGIIANKAGKFLFNINIAGDIAKGVAGGMGGLLSRGATPANPLFVKDVTGGLGGAAGAAGGLAGAGEGLGASAGIAGLSTLVGPLAIALVAAVGAPLLVAGVLKALGLGTQQPMSAQQAAASQGFGKGGGNTAAFVAGFSNNTGGMSLADRDIRAASIASAQRLADIKDADQSIASSTERIAASEAASLAAFRAKWGDDKSLLGGIKARAEAAFHHAVSASAIAATLQRDLIKRAAIIMDSTRSASTKLADLKVLQATATRHHDTKAAQIIAKQIATIVAVNSAKSSIVGAINQAAGLPAGYLDRGQDNPGGKGGLTPHQQHVLHVHATVSTRQTQAAQTTNSRYGKTSQTYVPG